MPLNTAIRHLKSGNWQKAHAVVQNDASEFGCWAHGIVHMLEGDVPNARYWYRRAGRGVEEGSRVSARLPAGIDAIVTEIAEQAMPDDERVWVPQAPDVWF